MKRLFILFLIGLLFTIPVFSQEGGQDEIPPSNFIYNWSIGTLGYGINLPFADISDHEITFSFLHLGLESRLSGIGLEFNPLTMFFWNINEDYWDPIELEWYTNVVFNTYYSLINLKLYWNIINTEGFYAGPYASINYLFLDDGFSFKDYVFTAGLHAGIRLNFDNVRYTIFTGEVGYRFINGKGRYHIGGKIDLLALWFGQSVSRHRHWYF